ncbi:MAG: NADH-quinone oxidoreductase subunit N [Actinomycetota bacterium]|nr:NADH-quinone oxidoreductase subunit N [Actinomycetota bacterium]MDA3013227.1 NADH-quinone oxidoreductase subunit N [Actinomycetota bacterium]
MISISEIIGFNFIVISPTVVLVLTALILLFFTITIPSSDVLKKLITFLGILLTNFFIFLKFGLYLTDGVSSYFSEKILLDEFSLFGNVLIGLILLFTFNSFWKTSASLEGKTTEAIILILMSASGFLLMIDSENFIMLFIGLEIGSISLYALAGLNRGDKLSNEASLKYFLLGSLASCVLIYGVALLYVSLSISGVYETSIAINFIGAQNVPLTTLIGMIFIIVGLLFKVAAAPFQAWAPDVYQGSPTGFVGYMATTAKAASFIVLARISAISIRFILDKFELFFTIVVLLSALLGALFATNQTDLKRLIAYSGVIQSGFILSGMVSGVFGISASLFYLFSYIVQLLGIFSIFSIIKGQLTSNFEIGELSGLFLNNKFLTISFSIFMFGLAGMPLTSGFVSKFILITNLWSYEKYLLVVVLMLSTVVGFYFYLRPIWIASIEKNENPLSKIDISTSDKVSVGLLAVVTLLLGILPNVLINLTRWVVENYI